MTVLCGTQLRLRIPVINRPLGAPSSQLVPTRLVKTAPNQYKAGPFIAILTSEGRHPFRGNRKNFIDIIRTGRQMGVTVFVLTPRGLSSHKSTVKGYLFNPTTTEKWVLTTLPMPDIVYNRIPDRLAEQQPEEQQALNLLKNTPGIHLFNPSFFDKWILHHDLMRSTQVRRYLPVSAQWGNRRTFFTLLRRFPLLYLKPVNGKAGQNMIRITRRTDKRFDILYQTTRGIYRSHLTDPDRLFQRLQALIGSRPYLLQQGIQLASCDGRPFDLRVLLQKGATGRWGITGIGTRLAGRNAISTHVPMGGKIGDTSKVLRRVFGADHQKIRRQVEGIALQLASQIERAQNANLGEMSMDIGVDTKGRIWFFEANAKPMKFDEPDIRSRSLQRLLHYCLFLSGFHSTREA